MSRGKTKKFNELKSFKNVFEWNDEDFKRNIKELFDNYEDIILELGCGKGEYTIYIGENNPDTLVVGIDIQGERIWNGAKYALENSLDNVFFFRMQIENIVSFIPKATINEIWLTFPDPYPKDRDSKKRLTSPRFLEMYKKILKVDGVIHLKTDAKDLYEYTKGTVINNGYNIIEDIEDIYGDLSGLSANIVDIKTTFENKNISKGKSIKYLKFERNEIV